MCELPHLLQRKIAYIRTGLCFNSGVAILLIPMTKARTTLSIEERVLLDIKKYAKTQHRTASEQIEKILSDFLAQIKNGSEAQNRSGV